MGLPYVTRRLKPYQEGEKWVWTRRDDELELYELDVSGLLRSGDTFSAVENKDSSGVTVDSIALSGNTLQVTISKGTGYLIAKLTTSADYIYELYLEWRSPTGVTRDAYS